MKRTLAIIVAAIAVAGLAAEVDLRTARITVADAANPTQRMAAEELERHLRLVAGERSPVTNGLEFAIGRVAPGRDEAREWESHAFATNNVLYFWGDDRTVSGKNRSCGTLFAVYGFIDKVLGVKWVRPGDDGIVFSHHGKTFLPEGWSYRFYPPLEKGDIRAGNVVPGCPHGLTRPVYYDDALTPEPFRIANGTLKKRGGEKLKWTRRQRLQTRNGFSYGHAFTRWNERFHGTHPEYMAKLSSGRRGNPNPNPNDRFLHICYSNLDVQDQIVTDWCAAGTNEYLNICASDSKSTHCRCDGCRAWDADAPGEDFQATKTDRQVKFWNVIAEKARAIRPDVKLVVYIYANYRLPPRRWRIEYPENVVAGVVPSVYDDSCALIRAWQEKGLRHYFVRPNYLCYKGAMPRGLERFLFEDFKENRRLGMIGVDEDNFGRGTVLDFEFYALARVIAEPTLSFGEVEREFLSQFGPAAADMREYYVRARARGEAARLAAMGTSTAGLALDDSQLAKSGFAGHTEADLDGDLAVIDRALARADLSALERKRAKEVRLMVEHAKLTLRFILFARREDGEFLPAAKELLDFRAQHVKEMREDWEMLFSDKRLEKPLWQRYFRMVHN